ncbi:nose resistant to fluoxetine protein 6-like [Anticarsia gemmatalis]|uniref:nose resistant to fluoxetine protein 6-like n=1 Tax=Anticarsia gemmatalis TaxID=129554 RepID=UPI003F770941
MLKNSAFILLFSSCLFICFVSTESLVRKTQVDLLIEELEDQTWPQDGTQCLKDTLFILNSVKNQTLWAVWIWNSIQNPTGVFYASKHSLGHYDQCMQAPALAQDPKISTQYCLANVKLTDGVQRKGDGRINVFGGTDEFLRTNTPQGQDHNLITWGVCLPSSCNPATATKVFKAIYDINPIAAAEPGITIDSCQLSGQETVYSFQFYLFFAILASLISLVILSSIYLHYNNEDTQLSRVAYSFSIVRNWSSFIKTTGEEIPVLSFTKAVVVIVTTCTHAIVFAVMAGVGNGTDFDHLIRPKTHLIGNLVQHIDLPAVENFFIISGLLVMKGLMEKKRNPFVALLQRYIRLVGSLSFLIFYTIAVSKYTGDGPLWQRSIVKETKICEKNWIWSLLMVNNYVNNDAICQVVTWYVPCDYQLAVLGTVLYCIWQWNKKVGKITTVVAGILALVIPGIVTYFKRIPGILLYDIEAMVDPRSNLVYLETYTKSYNRAGPYLMGMGMGYILMKYRPAKYRGIISKEWSYIGFTAATILALKVWSSASDWCFGDYNAWNSAIYAAFNRNIWALATCMCIAITEYGDVPKIRTIISWPVFVILSRLAYGVYMVHSLIMQRNFMSQRSPMHYDIFTLVIDGIGVMTASAILAVLLWLFVEAPLANLTNLLLLPRRPKANEVKKEIQTQTNGHITTELLKNGKYL